jgi:hypothetical protein
MLQLKKQSIIKLQVRFGDGWRWGWGRGGGGADHLRFPPDDDDDDVMQRAKKKGANLGVSEKTEVRSLLARYWN